MQIATGLILTVLGFVLGYFDQVLKPVISLVMHEIPMNNDTALTAVAGPVMAAVNATVNSKPTIF